MEIIYLIFKGKFNACFDNDHVFTTASLEGVPNQ